MPVHAGIFVNRNQPQLLILVNNHNVQVPLC